MGKVIYWLESYICAVHGNSAYINIYVQMELHSAVMRTELVGGCCVPDTLYARWKGHRVNVVEKYVAKRKGSMCSSMVTLAYVHVVNEAEMKTFSNGVCICI